MTYDLTVVIPVFNEEDNLERVKNEKIGLLCESEYTNEIMKEISDVYNVNRISYVDLNTVPPNNKEYKSRLERDFLIISQK